eukprot:g122.t1
MNLVGVCLGTVLKKLPKDFLHHECEITLKWQDASGHCSYVDALQAQTQTLKEINARSPIVMSISLTKHKQPSMVIAKLHSRKHYKLKRWIMPSVSISSSHKKCSKKSKMVKEDPSSYGGDSDSCYLGTSCFTLLYPNDKCLMRTRSLREIIMKYQEKRIRNKSKITVLEFMSQFSIQSSNRSEKNDFLSKEHALTNSDPVSSSRYEIGGCLSDFLSILKTDQGILTFERAVKIDSPESYLHRLTRKREELRIKKGHSNILQTIEKRVFSEAFQDELTELVNTITSQRRLDGSVKSNMVQGDNKKDQSLESRVNDLIKDPDGLQILLMEAVHKPNKCKAIDA